MKVSIGDLNFRLCALRKLKHRTARFKSQTHINFVLCFCGRLLDDVEVYEDQKPFSLAELVELSAFLNELCFNLIWHAAESLKGTSASGMGSRAGGGEEKERCVRMS